MLLRVTDAFPKAGAAERGLRRSEAEISRGRCGFARGLLQAPKRECSIVAVARSGSPIVTETYMRYMIHICVQYIRPVF